MERLPVLLTLLAYQLLLLGIGLWAARRNRDGADFYLGGRGLGPWVASISAAASSSSAWTLLGVSGLAFVHGLGAVWILPACVGGFALNWFVVARPLREASRSSGAVTLTDFLAQDAGRLRRALVLSASLILLVCLGGYIAAQFQAAGKTFVETFPETFGASPAAAVLVGGAVVLVYTMLGGFWAVSVTDLIQGLVMAAAAVAVPVAALFAVGGLGPLFAGMEAADPVLVDPFRGMAAPAALGLVLGLLGIGLGYPGQPHVVNRFMALRDEQSLRRGRVIALVWAAITYTGMLLAGWCARVLLDAGAQDSEASLIRLTHELFPPVVAGVIVAAILSAIMSTADSQLLVCGSAVAHDLRRRREGGGAAEVRLGRIAVVLLSFAAIGAALLVDETIFNSVLFAWSGLGAAFGPLLLVRLLRGPVSPPFALASMWSGFLVTAVWFLTPLKASTGLYELVPAFSIALLLAWMGARRPAAGST